MEIKIIKKSIYDFAGNRIGSNWGLEVIPIDKLEKSFAPVYPYSNDKEALEEFISVYKEELESFFESGERLYFCRHVWELDTKRREQMKEIWYRKGVIIN
ncbi:hypothetical protein [Streptococcus suis]